MERLPQALEGSETTPSHPHWALVERIAASPPFQSSPRLRNFLLYVADCALRNAPDEATEQHIGIHVFQRPCGYNSNEDNIVRSNARLLRQKLAEYFSQEGSEEETVLEIPKGHYLPVFRPRTHPEINPRAHPGTHFGPHLDGPHADELPKLQIAVAPGEPQSPPKPRTRLPNLLTAVLALLFLTAVLSGTFAWRNRRARQHIVDRAADHAADHAIDRFWAPFLTGPSLLIYSNALFVGDSATGMRYAPPGAVPSNLVSGNYVDTYTGVGELASVYDLTRLFDGRHAQFTLKRSLLVAWDEARTENLIFIGSVAENPSLRVLPDAMNFTLTTGDGWAGIVNRQPKPGEQALYSRPEHPLTRDYAILALLPGLEPGRKALIFSGLMTIGTQAAVEFACGPEGVQQILRVAGARDGSVHPFEAVLETTLGGGVPLETHLVAIHLR